MLKAIILAVIVFGNGQTMIEKFESVAVCERFALLIAPYVESVECETLLKPIGVRR